MALTSASLLAHTLFSTRALEHAPIRPLSPPQVATKARSALAKVVQSTAALEPAGGSAPGSGAGTPAAAGDGAAAAKAPA